MIPVPNSRAKSFSTADISALRFTTTIASEALALAAKSSRKMAGSQAFPASVGAMLTQFPDWIAGAPLSHLNSDKGKARDDQHVQLKSAHSMISKKLSKTLTLNLKHCARTQSKGKRQMQSHEAKSAKSPSTIVPVCSQQLEKGTTFAGRMKANPLKHLAQIIEHKLQRDFGTYNLLEIASEIQSEAQLKHNTTLRRIYDVVNVLEATGHIERINVSYSMKASRNLPAVIHERGDCSNSKTNQWTPKSDARSWTPSASEAVSYSSPEKSNARGSRIRWVMTEAEYKTKQAEKAAITERLAEKKEEYTRLQDEMRIYVELMEHNQMRALEIFQNAKNPVTPPLQEDWYLNLEEYDSSMSETGSNTHAQENPEFGLLQVESLDCDLGGFEIPSLMEFEDDWYESEEDVAGNGLEIPDFYQNVPREQLQDTILPGPEKGLHLPFVLLKTSADNNVDVELEGEDTLSVRIGLDEQSEVYDHTDVLQTMFPSGV